PGLAPRSESGGPPRRVRGLWLSCQQLRARNGPGIITDGESCGSDGARVLRSLAQASSAQATATLPPDDINGRIAAALIPEETRREVVQRPAPRLPLVGPAGRLEHDMLDARAFQALVHLVDGVDEPLLGGPGPDPEQPDLRIEGLRVAEGAAGRRLRVEAADGRRAERADGTEHLRMSRADLER